MIKESEPIRTQENESSLMPTAAAEYSKEDGKSMTPPPYQLSSGMDGAQFVGKMQAGLGTSLKDTKVVRNSPKASALGAKAFAEGNQIHFSPGQYQPDTKSGQDMLGHEIVHSVQQRKGMVEATEVNGGQKINKDQSLENQADSETAKIREGGSASSSLQNAAPMMGEAPAAQGFFGKIGKAIGGAAKKVGGAIKKGASAIGGGIKKVGGGILGGIKNIGGGILDGAKKIGGGILDGAKKIGGGILGGVKSGIDFVQDKVGGAWEKAKGVVEQIKGAGGMFKDAIGDGMSWIKGKVEQGLDGAQAVAAYVGNKIKATGSKVWNGIKKAASDPVGAIKDVVEGIAKSGSSAWSWMKGTGTKIFGKAKKLYSKIKRIGGKIKDHIKFIGGGLLGVIKSVGGGLLEGASQILSGNIVDGLKGIVGGVAKGLLGSIETFLGATAGLLDRMVGPTGEKVEAEEIPSRHVMDEFLAHRISYKDAAGLANGSALSPKEVEILQNGGYDPDSIMVRTGPNGFQAVLIMPAEEGLNPMLAIRGTADMGGGITDMDPKQVGDYQYKNNAATIAGMIKAAGGKVDLSGHSLGGAMAQITAAHHTSSVGRVTTFQSPGISSDTADMYKDNIANMKEDDRPEVAHHTVKHDLVSKAGEENLPGSIYEHDLGSIDPLEAHTTYMSATSSFEESRAQYGITNDFMENEVGKEIKNESTIKKFEENPYKYQRYVAEFARGTVGNIKDGIVGMITAGKGLFNKAKSAVGKGVGMAKNLIGKGKGLLMSLVKMAKKKGKSGLSKLKTLLRKIAAG